MKIPTPFRSRLALLPLLLIAALAWMFTSSNSTRSLHGSLLDDRVLTLGDINPMDGTFSVREMRKAITNMLRAIALDGVQHDAAYDLNGDGVTDHVDLTLLIQSIRAYLAAVCGNGVKEGNEECDDGNAVNNDFCTGLCKLAKCGDGFMQGSEQCDDGNTSNADGCTNSCALPVCGDGIRQSGEECDDGNQSNTDGCTNACQTPVCGDDFVRSGYEQCDDGNTSNSDACNTNCQIPPSEPLLCRQISCTQFATLHASFHQMTYLGLSNGVPYYSACELHGIQYLINAQTGQITTNGTCTGANKPTGTPVDSSLANGIARMLGVGIAQPAVIMTSPVQSTIFMKMSGHSNKVTIGGSDYVFSAQSCGVTEVSCSCAIADAVDGRYCYMKK